MTVRVQARKALRTVAAVVVTAVLAGAGYVTLRAPDRREAPAPAQLPEGVRANKDPFARQTAPLDGPPTRLRIEAAGIDTGLEHLRLGAGGELEPPASNDKAGWYAAGTAPGDVGPAVLAGHVDSRTGPAVFFRLHELRPSDTVEVTRGGAVVAFTVTGSAWYPKSAFPSGRVHGPTPDRQLRLITCGGSFDRAARSYRENLVVYAVAG